MKRLFVNLVTGISLLLLGAVSLAWYWSISGSGDDLTASHVVDAWLSAYTRDGRFSVMVGRDWTEGRSFRLNTSTGTGFLSGYGPTYPARQISRLHFLGLKGRAGIVHVRLTAGGEPVTQPDIAPPPSSSWSPLLADFQADVDMIKWDVYLAAPETPLRYWCVSDVHFALPFSLLLIIPVARIAAAAGRSVIRSRREAAARCAQCGYDLRGGGERCGECGALTPIGFVRSLHIENQPAPR